MRPHFYTVSERLARYEVDENNCHNWTGATNYGGYGVVWDGTKTQKAHRLAYLVLVGDIPEGADLHHLCENKKCINPDHVELLTRSEHVRLHRAV